MSLLPIGGPDEGRTTDYSLGFRVVISTLGNTRCRKGGKASAFLFVFNSWPVEVSFPDSGLFLILLFVVWLAGLSGLGLSGALFGQLGRRYSHIHHIWKRDLGRYSDALLFRETFLSLLFVMIAESNDGGVTQIRRYPVQMILASIR